MLNHHAHLIATIFFNIWTTHWRLIQHMYGNCKTYWRSSIRYTLLTLSGNIEGLLLIPSSRPHRFKEKHLEKYTCDKYLTCVCMKYLVGMTRRSNLSNYWKRDTLTIGVVTLLSSRSQSWENGDVARSPWKAEGEEWRMKKTSCA